MPNPPPEAHPDVHNDDVRYERRDVPMRPLLLAAAALAALAVVAGLASAGLFNLFAQQSQRSSPTMTAPAALDTARQLQELRVQEEKLLSEYAWIDKETGIVRIPIEQAMKLVVEQAKEDIDDD